MVSNNRVDHQPKLIIAALLSDVQTLHSDVFTPRALKLTIQKVESRCAREGIGFLTKTLPRLAKAFDKALTGEVPLNSISLAFESLPNSQLPRFLGELFQCIFSHDGRVLPDPCVQCIKAVRQVLYPFYRYKLPHGIELEENVVNKFIQVENEVSVYHHAFSRKADALDEIHSAEVGNNTDLRVGSDGKPSGSRMRVTEGFCKALGVSRIGLRIIRRARRLLNGVFGSFDPLDIRPKHGPGAVSTREQLWDKYRFSCIPSRITDVYPLDAFFYASVGHVCDTYRDMSSLSGSEVSARVILVPKDSRGPRLISCEPLAFQWIQQGLGRAIVDHVERHRLTRGIVNFTDQEPNRSAARLASTDGRYSTLDLNEASDRVSVGLVRLLFPENLSRYLLACRSLSTTLPGGKELVLDKFAPMGSALCFPVLALTIWAILTAGLSDADVGWGKPRIPNILVYGDDVIVPTALAANAIMLLESFGLKVNRDKSCISGFFRESCGMDAYKGVDVTPVRFRTVWSSHRCPDTYTSYISYANALYKQKFYKTYDLIVGGLLSIYGEIPEKRSDITDHSLIEVPEANLPRRSRVNRNLQKREWLIWDVKAPKVHKEIDGWSMLLRYFTEAGCQQSPYPWVSPRRSDSPHKFDPFRVEPAFSVRSYTKQRSSILVRRWR
jgi:hypothetical protein